MRQHLPILFEVFIAGVIIAWGVRELILLKRDKNHKDEDDPE
jgi:hypothetical protein